MASRASAPRDGRALEFLIEPVDEVAGKIEAGP